MKEDGGEVTADGEKMVVEKTKYRRCRYNIRMQLARSENIWTNRQNLPNLLDALSQRKLQKKRIGDRFNRVTGVLQIPYCTCTENGKRLLQRSS